MKFTILSMVLLLTLACSKSSVEETKLQPLPQSSAQQTPIPTKPKIDGNNDRVYAVLLEDFGYNTNESGNWMIVRKETIAPNDLEEVKYLPDLSPAVVGDFIENNETKEKLHDDYDVKFGLKIIEIKGSLESIFKTEDAKGRKDEPLITLKAIVGLSRVGFNEDNTQSLVYVEYYRPEKGTQKKYCLITWKREGLGIMRESIKWF